MSNSSSALDIFIRLLADTSGAGKAATALNSLKTAALGASKAVRTISTAVSRISQAFGIYGMIISGLQTIAQLFDKTQKPVEKTALETHRFGEYLKQIADSHAARATTAINAFSESVAAVGKTLDNAARSLRLHLDLQAKIITAEGEAEKARLRARAGGATDAELDAVDAATKARLDALQSQSATVSLDTERGKLDALSTAYDKLARSAVEAGLKAIETKREYEAALKAKDDLPALKARLATVQGNEAFSGYMTPEAAKANREALVDITHQLAAAEALAAREEELKTAYTAADAALTKENAASEAAAKALRDQRTEVGQLTGELAQLKTAQTQLAASNTIAADADAQARLARQKRAAALEQNAAAQILANNELARIEREKELLTLDRDLSEPGRQERLNALYEEQRKTLAKIVELKRQQLGLTPEGTPQAAALEGEIAGIEGQSAILGKTPAPETRGAASTAAYSQFSSGADPGMMGMGEGMFVGMEEWVVSLGSTGEQVAASLQATLGTALDAIGDNITSLIMGTKTWADALRSIGTSIITQVVNAIIKMFATWIAQKTAMAVLDTALNKKSLAESAAKATANATEGGTKSIAQMGPWGALAFVAALAVVIAAAAAVTGGFAEGGFTGPGGKYDPAGIVHKGEFVLPADVVDATGTAPLYSMIDSVRGGAAAEPPAAAPSPANSDISMQLHLDADTAFAAALKSPASQRLIIDLVRQHKTYI